MTNSVKVRKKYFLITKYLFAVIGSFAIQHAKADVVINPLFSDNAVLQQGVAVPVWGTAADGEQITIEFDGQRLQAIANGGNWMVKLKPLKAGGPFDMTIKGNNSFILHNILVGEVWLAGGQSNMEKTVGPRKPQPDTENWQAEAATANYPMIREFSVAHTAGSYTPNTTVTGKWAVCDSVTVKKFSAVGYFFARDLYQKLKIPIGIIHSSVGGTPAEKWLSKEALAQNPDLSSLVTTYEKAIKDFPTQLADFKANESTLIEKWVADTLKAHEEKKPIPRKPTAPVDPVKAGDCGGLYNSMIAPLVPYAIKGVIWYQGESNSSRASQYKILFPALIQDWRAKWNEGDFPFLFVQIAPYHGHPPELREAQLLTFLNTPNTAMVVTTDCVDSTYNLHPAQKQPVGLRLSLAARALAYKEKIEFSGPIYQSVKFDGNRATLSFTHVANGFIPKSGTIGGFVIADATNPIRFVPAKATVDGNNVIVYADGVSNPVAVRYNWLNIPKDNFYNTDNLPASPFRTDPQSLK
jgi:sialate O-acetylesterase